MTSEAGRELPPRVAELVGKVEAGMARAATLEEIRALAEKALRDTRDNTLTVAEIAALVNVAIDRAKRVDALVARLAELVSEASGDG